MSFKLIRQHDTRDCGAACLAMVATSFGHFLTVAQSRELTKTDRTGTNLYGLVDGAAKIGLQAEALSGEPNELLDGLQNKEFGFPFVAHTVSEQGMLHFVVVYGQNNGSFLVADPGKGKSNQSHEEFFAHWTGYIVTFTKGEDFVRTKKQRPTLLRFFRLAQEQWRWLGGVFLLSLPVSGIGMAGAYVFQIAINYCLKEASLPAAFTLNTVFLLVIGLYLLAGLLRYLRGLLILHVSRQIDLALVLDYFHHLTALPVESFAVRQTGEYISRFSDADTIRNAVSGATVTLLLDTIMVVGCGVLLWLQNDLLFLLALVIVVVYAVISLCFLRPMENANRRTMENNAMVQSYFKEAIDGLPTVKSACAEAEVQEKSEKKFTDYLQAAIHAAKLGLIQDTLVDTVELVGTALLLWAGFVMAQQGVISLGCLITFYALLAYFTNPVKNLIELQPTLQTAFVAADRLNDVFALRAEELNPVKPLVPVQEWRLKEVNFRYGNHELTLEGIDLSLRRGEKIALVGESGSGKTTVAKLLQRFYRAESGEVLLDDVPIEEFDLHTLRGGVAYIDQNTYLFADTIKNNLLLGQNDLSDDDLAAACQASRVEEFVQRLPLGYDTPLDENGANLSGGQRQRLAIARALLKKPQLLIMDEATSNLDTVTEAAIRDAVFALDDDLTCLIIAHRLSTVKNCDRICVMERGRIVEQGTHQELLDQNGRYAELLRNQ